MSDSKYDKYLENDIDEAIDPTVDTSGLRARVRVDFYAGRISIQSANFNAGVKNGNAYMFLSVHGVCDGKSADASGNDVIELDYNLRLEFLRGECITDMRYMGIDKGDALAFIMGIEDEIEEDDSDAVATRAAVGKEMCDAILAAGSVHVIQIPNGDKGKGAARYTKHVMYTPKGWKGLLAANDGKAPPITNFECITKYGNHPLKAGGAAAAAAPAVGKTKPKRKKMY